MRDDLERRARELAVYLIERRTTIRDAAKHFSVSKSTVHKDLSERLREIDRSLYVQVKEILEQNKAERTCAAATRRSENIRSREPNNAYRPHGLFVRGGQFFRYSKKL